MAKINENKKEEIVYDSQISKKSFGKGNTNKIKNKIKILEREKKEYLEGWQRARAELVNVQKQHKEEKKLFTQLGKQAFLEEIIPILDNFDAAFLNKEAWEKTPEEWRSGIEYIYSQFLNVLENNGVKQYAKILDNFDEKIHHSVKNIKTKEKKNIGKIAEIVQSGYMLGDKIIREAKVKVFVGK